MNNRTQLIGEVADRLRELRDDSGRLFHGRSRPGHPFAHLCLDRIGPVLFATEYDSGRATEATAAAIAVAEAFSSIFETVMLQTRDRPRCTTQLIRGREPERPQIIREQGLNYLVDLGQSQNIGFFFDSANLRAALREESDGLAILNLFSYTCSYSVAAMAGGARRVVNIDLSKTALERGRGNHRLNGLDTDRVVFRSFDILNSWNAIARLGPYDWVIVDPPTDQGRSFKAQRDYSKIVRRLPMFLGSTGRVTACLNDPFVGEAFLIELFHEHAPEFIPSHRTLPAAPFRVCGSQGSLKIIDFKHPHRG